MPDREIIHSTADVTAALLFALESGFQVRIDIPQPEPRPRFLERSEVGTIANGIFFLFRPEWVYGPLQIMSITGGHNSGKFTVSPGVNVAAISLYFGGERADQGRRRLGAGAVSFDHEWLELPAKAVRPTPPDVGAWFQQIFAHMSSGAAVKAGVHKYWLCRGVTNDPSAGDCLPPFDFIPWSSDIIQRSVTR